MSAIRTAVKTPIPKQTPSPNLSPARTMMSAAFHAYGLIRLHEIETPGLRRVFPDQEDDKLSL
jgi:hypothetical protein